MPHLRYVDLDSHGFSIVDVDPERVRFEWWTVEGVSARSEGSALAASMSVRHGVPRLLAEGETESGAMRAPSVPRSATAGAKEMKKPARKARRPATPE